MNCHLQPTMCISHGLASVKSQDLFLNSCLAFVFAYSIFGMMILNGCSQAAYDNDLISTEKELNLVFSDKRGIKGDDGVVYFVQRDGLTLTAYKGSEVKWTVNFSKTCEETTVKKSEIQYMGLTGEKIQLIFTKRNFANIDVRDGKTTYRCGY